MSIIALTWHLAAVSDDLSSPETCRLDRAVFVLIVLCFALAEWNAFHWTKTDPPIYHYAAYKLLDGIVPYRDYFYAHPPMRVVIPAIVYGIFGFSIYTAKLLSIAPIVVIAVCFRTILKQLLGPKLGAIAGLIAAALLLSNLRIMVSACEMTGVNITGMFVALAVLAAVKNHPVLSGVSYAIGLGVGMICVWWAPVLALITLFTSRFKGLLKLGVATIGAFGLIFGGAYLVGGEQFITGVFSYHTMKPPRDANFIAATANPIQAVQAIFWNTILIFDNETIKSFVQTNLVFWLGGVVGPVVVIGRIVFLFRSQDKARALSELKSFGPLVLAPFGGLAFFSLLREHYAFYWSVFVPILATLAAVAFVRLGAALSNKPTWPRFLITFVLVFPTYTVSSWGLLRADKAEVTKAGLTEFMPWRASSPYLTFDDFNATMLQKTHRVRGELESSLDRFMWMKKKEYSMADDIAQYIVESTTEDSTITGASTLVPLLALMSGRRISDDQVDTNYKTFLTGIHDTEEFWRKACEDNVQVIIGPGAGVFGDKKLFTNNTIVKKNFRKTRIFADPGLAWRGEVMIYIYQLKNGIERCTP